MLAISTFASTSNFWAILHLINSSAGSFRWSSSNSYIIKLIICRSHSKSDNEDHECQGFDALSFEESSSGSFAYYLVNYIFFWVKLILYDNILFYTNL